MASKFQLIKGLSGTRDRRGLVTVEYEALATEMSEAQALSAELPYSVGLPEVGRRIKDFIDNRSFTVSVTFEGLPGNVDPSEDQDQFMVDKEYREEPIETFPDQAALEKYGAYEDPDRPGKLAFPKELSSSSSGSGSGLGAQRSADNANPLYGVTTYPVRLFVATWSFCRLRAPNGFFNDDGNVIKSLPPGFRNPPKGPFIVDKGGTRKRGNCVECIARYKQLPKSLKHIEALYLLLQK